MLRCSLSLLVILAIVAYVNAATTHTIAGTSSLTWNPSTITIAVGDSIKFTNLGDGFHVPVALKGAASDCSGGNEDTTLWTPPGSVTEFVAGPFTTAQVFNFKCRPHCLDGMTGTITVGSSPTTTKAPTTTTAAATTTKAAATTTTAAATTTKAAATTTTAAAATTTTAASGTSTAKPTTTTTTKKTTQSSSGSNNNGGGCFAADSQVRVLSATNTLVEKQLSHVVRGDMIESFDANGKPAFSRVYFVAHRNSAAQVPLLQLVLANNASTLAVTPNHLVLAASGGFVPAGSLKAGDSLFVRDAASSGLKPVQIQRIDQASGQIRSALTVNDNIVVSDVAASVFVESVWFYRLLAAPLKFMDAYFPSLLDEGSFASAAVDALIDLTDFVEAHLPKTSFAAHSFVRPTSN